MRILLMDRILSKSYGAALPTSQPIIGAGHCGAQVRESPKPNWVEPASPLQVSVVGLLATGVYDLMEQLPAQGREVFPVSSTGDKVTDLSRWSEG
jgi:hypothetical protein